MMNSQHLLYHMQDTDHTIHDQDAPTVASAQLGQARAVGSLYQKYVAPIYRYCIRQLRNPDDAQDVTHNVFYEMLKSLHTFAGRSSFKNWLYTLAKHQIARWLRRKYLLPTIPLEDYMLDHPQSLKSISPQKRENTQLLQKIRQLSPLEQDVLKLRYQESLSVKDTADHLSISPTNVKVLAHRAIKKLRSRAV